MVLFHAWEDDSPRRPACRNAVAESAQAATVIIVTPVNHCDYIRAWANALGGEPNRRGKPES